MKQLGIGIVGCGYWGINHVRVFSELPESRVAAVCDVRQERLQEVQQRFAQVAVTTDLDELIGRQDVDAIVICTAANSHYDIASICLQAGKHVLLEKPLTTKVSDAEELIRLAESRGVKLMVGHTFLYNAAVRKVKTYTSQGELGKIYYLYAQRTNLGPIREDVSAMWDLAPHDVSIFNYLLDSTPEWVSAVGARVLGNGHEDVGFVSMGYPDGVIGHVHISWADPHKVREVVVVGSDKRIVFNDLSPQEQVRVYEKGVKPVPREAPSYGEYHFLLRNGDIIIPNIEASEPLKNECKHFLDCIIDDRIPLSDGENGLEVVRVMEAVDRSLEQRGAPVEVSYEASL